jgi:cell fate regulator YaaT (PSP1 superfamily)
MTENKNIATDNVRKCQFSQCKNCDSHCSELEYIKSDANKCFIMLEFKGHRIDVFLNYKNISLFNGDYAVVTAEVGFDAGKVIYIFNSTEELVEKKYKCKSIKTIVRKANEYDLEKLYLNREEEKYVIEKTTIIAQSYGLEMEVMDVEWQFDKYKLTIFFTAPQRIDFRELVKDLARQFKARIELRQINTREEIARTGNSIGCCGKPVCCNTFLLDYNKVLLEHAKIQKLSNNVSKLSGNCMRLKCCMAYEFEFYETELAKYPTLYSTIIKSDIEYKLNKIDIFKQEITLHNMKDKSYQIMNITDMEKFLKNANIIKPICIEEVPKEVIVEEDIIIDD